MTIDPTCKVKDDLVNELIALNDKLNTLSPSLLRSREAQAEVQEKRESLYIELKLHRKRGHGGKPCPAARFLRKDQPIPRLEHPLGRERS
jgi:hypothetical protein